MLPNGDAASYGPNRSGCSSDDATRTPTTKRTGLSRSARGSRNGTTVDGATGVILRNEHIQLWFSLNSRKKARDRRDASEFQRLSLCNIAFFFLPFFYSFLLFLIPATIFRFIQSLDSVVFVQIVARIEKHMLGLQF